jgi:iron complex transport system substrate-binding protein
MIRNSTQRIVSLAPSATSILFALGARRQIVGVTKWCADVAPVGRLPRLGDCWSLDLDAVAKLRPTLIIGSVPYRAEVVERVLGIGAPFLAMNPRTLADVYSEIQLLGRLVDRMPAANRTIRRMEAAFARLARRAKRSKSRPRVYCEAWSNPRITSPPWVDELVRIAGGEPVLPGGRKISDEDVARANPGVIILAWTATGTRADSRQALENPLWQAVPAIRNRRVHVVRDEMLNTPAPILVEGAGELFRILHPGASAAKSSRGQRASR